MEWLLAVMIGAAGLALLAFVIGVLLVLRANPDAQERAFVRLSQLRSRSGSRFFPEPDSAHELARELSGIEPDGKLS